MRHIRDRGGQRGLGLVEMMIAMAIGLFLAAGIIQLFVSSKQAYSAEEALARLQENGRFAVETIARDIRMAGYLGCRTHADGVPVNFLAQGVWDVADNMTADNSPGTAPPYIASPLPYMLFGYDADTAGQAQAKWDTYENSLNLTAIGRVTASDVLQITAAFGKGTYLASDLSGQSDDLTLHENVDRLSQGDWAVVTDCDVVDVVAVANAPAQGANAVVEHDEDDAGGTQVNASDNLSKIYKAGARVLPFRSRVYFIGLNPDNDPSLYVLGLDGSAAQELVDNVEDLQIWYGVDTNSDEIADLYYTAAEMTDIADWGHVYSVRVDLLLRTADRVTEQPVNFTFGNLFGQAGYEVNPAPNQDRRLRAVFSSTVAIRNNMP